MEPAHPTVFSRTLPATFYAQTPQWPYMTFKMELGSLQRLVVKTWVTDQGWRHDNVESNDSHTGLEISFRFYLQEGAIDIPPDSPPVFIASLMSSAGIRCDSPPPMNLFLPAGIQYGPPPPMSLLPSARIRCHTQEWSFGEPNEDDKQNGMQRTFLQNLPTDKTLEFGVIPSVRSEGSVWKMEVEVHSESPLPSGQTGNEQGHIRPIPMNRQAKSWRFLESSETAHLRRQTLDAAIQNHPDTENFYDRVETALTRLFNIANSQGNVNEAIEIAMIAHDIVPPDHPDYIWWINNLCFKLCDRAEHNGSIEDFNRVVRIAERALEELGSDLMPKGDLRRVSLLVNFGNWLNRRFDYTGATEDIVRSAERTTEALQMTSLGNPFVLVVLSSLANRVCVRIQPTGLSKHVALQFIDPILFDAETALKRFHSDDHTTTTMLIGTLSSLGNLLDCRFEQTGSPQDFDSAVTYREAAVSLAYKLKHHLDSAAGRICDSQIAVGNAEAGIQLACKNEPQLAKLLGNLGACLAKRFERKNSKLDSTMADLHRAIEISDTAVYFSLRDSDIRAALLLNLGNQLRLRYRHTRFQEDSDRRLKCYEQGCKQRNQLL
ncbi:hypothetical protein HDK77DRAFT_489024 [Phyllosticta capitalensis]